MAEHRLQRIAFSTSRLAEFCSESELVRTTGHPVEEWPLVVVKEFVDNALDECEAHDIAPVIQVDVDSARGTIAVTDNGPGLPAAVVDKILDYSNRTSSRSSYVGPTRGQQGNALQSIIAMFALDGGGAHTIIESQGIEHRITLAVDPIRRVPRITHEKRDSLVKRGTRIAVEWGPKASDRLEDAKTDFLQVVDSFELFNPHLACVTTWNGEQIYDHPDTDPLWSKWRACDPTSPHWYDLNAFQRYLAAHVAYDRDHEQDRPVRELVAEFCGLSHSAKQRAILAEIDAARLPLSALFPGDQIDHDRVARLLGAMRRESKPVTAKRLGVIGREHIHDELVIAYGGDPESFRYHSHFGDDDSAPFMIEAAFANCPDREERVIRVGVNFSGAITFPFQWLGQNLTARHVYEESPVVIALHYTCPRVEHLNRGKSALAIPPPHWDAIKAALDDVTTKWVKVHQVAERARETAKRTAQRKLEDQQRAERAKTRAPMTELVGTGKLCRHLAEAARAACVPLSKLTVLSNDPFRWDTPTGRQNGAWFKEQVDRFVVSGGIIHLRGLHYRIVSAGDVIRPDGNRSPFVNDDLCWDFLQKAAQAGRWLQLVDFHRIKDERNAPPQIFLPEAPQDGVGYLAQGVGVDIPALSAMLPSLFGTIPVAQQPYRIVLIGEKSSLADVLLPIARRVRGELLLMTGESSESFIYDVAARAAADGRPTVVLQASDYDPSGWQMPISVARKLQGHKELDFPDLQIELHRIALTLEQAEQFDLPSTPLKKEELRAANWRAKTGREQTEVDALAALRSDVLEQIVLEAVTPFFDFTLEQRCLEERDRWLTEAQDKIAGHPAFATAERKIKRECQRAERAAHRLHEVQSKVHAELEEQLGVGRTTIVAPVAQIDAVAPTPLFTTTDDFVTATTKLIADKKYDFDESEG